MCVCVWLVSPQQKSAPENINQEKFIKEKAPQIMETEKKIKSLKFVACDDVLKFKLWSQLF